MARLTFPDEGSRLLYDPATGSLLPVNTRVYLYLDAAATQAATDLLDAGGTPITVGYVASDAFRRLPLFQGPTTGADTLYAVVGGTGPITPIYARTDDRLDTLNSRVTVLETDSPATAVQSVNGHTGTAVTVTKGDVGLGNVDNTSDVNKPVSTAQAAADAAVLSTAEGYTDTKVTALVNSAPAILDTLGEIATQLQSDESAATALTATVAGKQNVVVHGATAGTARPAGATLVHWVGSVQPTNAATNDEWTDTANKALKRWTGSVWDLIGSGSFEPVGRSVGPLKVAWIGDSRNANNMKSPGGVLVVKGNDWLTTSPPDVSHAYQPAMQGVLTWACQLSGGRMVEVYNGAVSGATTADMVATYLPALLTKTGFTHVFLGDARNDIAAGTAESVYRANTVAMIATIRAAGLTPILYTILPDTSSSHAYSAGVRRYNTWLRQYAATNGLLLVDPYAVAVDPTNASGDWVSGYSADGTHPTLIAASVIGQKVLDDLSSVLLGNTAPSRSPLLPQDRVGGPGRNVTLTAATTSSTTITASAGGFSLNDVGRAVSWSGSPAGVYIAGFTSSTAVTLSTAQTISNGTVVTLAPHSNLLLNPLFQDDVNADGIADSWSLTQTGTTPTVVTDSGVIGKAQQLVVASGTVVYQQTVTVDGVNVSVGDRVAWSGMIKTANAAAGAMNYQAVFSQIGATYVVQPTGQIVGVELGWTPFYATMIVQSGASQVRARYQVDAGTGTLLIAQNRISNLSAIAGP